ncbi:MAG: hypothetical protein ACPG05_04330 [Bdellovibrionales bacterium]
MSNFDAWLADNYRARNFLTSAKADWTDCVEILPEASEKSCASSASFDGIYEPNHCLRGSGAVSLGCVDVDIESFFNDSLQYDGAFLYGAVIKEAGSDTHRLPRELSFLTPAVQRFADYQYKNSPYATDKVAAVSFRLYEVRKDVVTLGEALHLHKNFADVTVLKNRLKFFDNLSSDISMFENVSPDMVNSEALLSNICPSRVQERPCERDLKIKHTEHSCLLDDANDVDIPLRLSGENEMVAMDNYTWHGATCPRPEDYGKVRLLFVVDYCPTHKMKKDFC